MIIEQSLNIDKTKYLNSVNNSENFDTYSELGK